MGTDRDRRLQWQNKITGNIYGGVPLKVPINFWSLLRVDIGRFSHPS